MRRISALAKRAGRQRPSRLGAFLIGAVLVLAALLGSSSYLADAAMRERREAARWEEHTLEILNATTRLESATLSTVNGERGFLLTGDAGFLEPYETGRAQLRADIALLAERVADNPAQMTRLSRLEGQIDQHLAVMDTMIGLTQSGQRAVALERVTAGEGRNSAFAVQAAIDAFEREERRLLSQRASRLEQLRDRSEKMQAILGWAGALLLLVGIWAAIALRRSLLREAAVKEQLRRIAMTDELTGLANRREVLGSLDRMIGSARRTGRPLSLAILDIDRFKRVNDTYGHPAGDEVIRAVGRVATQIMREQDLVGRLGGEEFIVAFPDCDALRALDACQRLRRAIADLPIIVEGGVALHITLSSGVAEYREGCDRTTLIARADEALYEAKEGGRDQVRLAA